MTPEQRAILEQLLRSTMVALPDEPGVVGWRSALAAALADLDACRNEVIRRRVELGDALAEIQRIKADLDAITAERDRLRALMKDLGWRVEGLKADLDACRAALRPVAREIVNWRDGGDHRAHAPDRAYLTTTEAAAVLAAAGGQA